MKNTGASSIVCFTILVLPVLLDEEYWYYQYYNIYNTGNTSIVNITIPEIQYRIYNDNFIVFGLTRPGFEPTIYRTRGEHANYYATDAVPSLIDTCITKFI
jgi:hypothetical protein